MQRVSASVESSVMSRSLTGLSNAKEVQSLIMGRSSIIDLTFPFIDEILKDIELPKILYILLVLYNSLQFIVTSFWPGLIYSMNYDDGVGHVLHYIFEIALMSSLEKDSTGYMVTFLIIAIISLLSVFVFLVQVFIYKAKRHFTKWTLYPSKFIFEFGPLLILIPTSNFIGMMFIEIVKPTSVVNYVYFVLSVLFFAVQFLMQYIQSFFFSSSPYIPKSLIACWSGKVQFMMYWMIPILLIIQYIFQIFDRWIDTLTVAISILFNIFFIYTTFNFPFILLSTNVIVMTIFSSRTALDLIELYIIFEGYIDEYIKIVVLFAVAIISAIIFNYLTKYIYKDVAKKLTIKALENVAIDDAHPSRNENQNLFLADEKIRQWYSINRLDKNPKKCELWMRVGIAERSDLYLNWSLFKYMAEFHSENKRLMLVITQALCFFPCESRLLKYFFTITSSKPGMVYHERFEIFEIHRVMDMRQNSSSAEITDKLVELKDILTKGICASRNFWKEVHSSIDVFYRLYIQTVNGKAMFQEALDKWPNNSRINEDYTLYLIECATDFIDGVKYKNRSEMIDQGKNFVVDYSFKSLVHVYPYYLKRNVLDIKGNFLRKDVGSKSASSSSSANRYSTSDSMNSELDAEIEEELSKQLFNFHRLRLEFQKAIKTRRSPYEIPLKGSIVVTLVLLVTFCLFFYFYFSTLFDPRRNNMRNQRAFNEIRYGLDASITSLILYWAKGINVFPSDLWSQMQTKSPGTNNYNIHVWLDDFLQQVTTWTQYGRSQQEDFIADMVKLAANGDDVMSYTGPMFASVTEFNYCSGDTPIPVPVNSSLKSIFAFEFLRLRELSLSPNDVRPATNTWDHSENLCEIFSNLNSTFNSFNNLAASLSDKQDLLKESTTRNSYTVMFSCCIIYAIFTAPFMSFFLFKYYNDIKKLLSIMMSIDDQNRKDAANPFKQETIDGDKNQESISDSNGSVNPHVILVIIIFSLLIGIAILIGIVMLSEAQNTQFMKLNGWMEQGLARGNYIMEVVYFVTYVLMINGTYVQEGVRTLNQVINSATISLGRLISANNLLLHGSGGMAPCIGLDPRFDEMNLHEFCENGVTTNLGTIHDSYVCASIDKSISVLDSLVSDILRSPNLFTFDKNGYFYHIFHIMNVHLIDYCFESADILTSSADNAISSFKTTLLIICMCGIVYAFIAFALFYILVHKCDCAYQGALQLLRRIPPLSFTSNPSLMAFLLNKKENKVIDKMTASQSVIMMSNDAVLCLSRNESIEVLNPAVTTLFGFTPEQILGQPINCIISTEKNEEIFHNFALMRQGQCSLTYDTSGIGLTDDDQEMKIHVTILGIPDDDGQEASSFAVIIRDDTMLFNHMKEAEEAKAQSEKLLYQILPRDIVTRLNQGETDISFVVPCASIIFIDIVKWSDYSTTLSPSQIMSNLSNIFAKFDVNLGKYNLITKIKLIGDVYMAAAGLFAPDEPNSKHASQMIQFGLDCLGSIEEVNSQLDSSLQVRTGINTDGPLIAGVLGTDKPVFDIIGDPINVSSRLQSTCIPGTIQISQSTYDQVAEMNFNIEKRGEIELKGKGKKMAYIVHPVQAGSYFFQSDRSTTSE